MRGVAPAETVLRDLGIVSPEDIDLEVIAWHLGAKVKYRQLNSCEARIVGREHRAIITVDNRKLPERQRYSIGHELGHWHFHRGRSLICRSEEFGSYKINALDPERVADGYASDLLMPWYLFTPVVRSFRKFDVAALRQIKAAFSVSLTAAAFRVMESDQFAAVLVVHSQQGRRYFFGARSVPGRWFPKDELDPESHAFDMLFGKAPEMAHPRKIGADAWFDRADAHKFNLLEQATKWQRCSFSKTRRCSNSIVAAPINFVMTAHPIFTLAVLQAVSDWQRGGSHKQQIKRGEALKTACANLPLRYRQFSSWCYRQEAHEQKRTWQLLIDNTLPETIAAWTLSLDVAQTLKGGVPPLDHRGIIFRIAPEPNQVIVNIATLYDDPQFIAAAEARKPEINGYYSGIGTYGNTQREVVLELGTLDRATVYSYGGFAGTYEQLAAVFEEEHGIPPPPEAMPEIKALVGKPHWLSSQGTFKVVSRTLGQAMARRWLPDI